MMKPRCAACLQEFEQRKRTSVVLSTPPSAKLSSIQGSLTGNQALSPVSVIPVPAAGGHREDTSIRPEDLSSPLGNRISDIMAQCWKSNGVQLAMVKAIYRLELPASTYRLFDTALQMNEGCTITTSYYGARDTCGLSNDTPARANPCILEYCPLCTAIRSAFGCPLYGNSSNDGIYGPGICTHLNSAEAHYRVTEKSSKGLHRQSFAMLQCRMVTEGSDKAYAARVEEMGLVFCAQAITIIPTHLIVYDTYIENETPTEQTGSFRSVGLQDGRTGLSAGSSADPSRIISKPPDVMSSVGQEFANDDVQSSGCSLEKMISRWNMEDNIEDEEVEDEPDEPDERHVTLPNNAKAIFFYEGNGLYNEFTSAGPYPITFRGKQYPTAEHLYQARKFLDHRPTLAEHIRRGSDRPRFALTEARRFQNETRQDWNDICISVMDEILELKFSQHVILRRMLVATGSRILIYSCGKYDDFLGNGADGNRRNELGLALMRLRSKLTKREVIEEK